MERSDGGLIGGDWWVVAAVRRERCVGFRVDGLHV